MDNILKERLVNRSDKENFRFTLTCAVCGAVWQSTPIPVEGNRDHFQSAYLEAHQAAYREAEALGFHFLCHGYIKKGRPDEAGRRDLQRSAV